MSDYVADILDDAADVIEKNGWHQNLLAPPGSYQGEVLTTKPVCAMGAIRLAQGECIQWYRDSWITVGGSLLEETEQVYDALRRVVDRGVTFWNDDPNRTKQEVLDAFRQAAKRERMR